MVVLLVVVLILIGAIILYQKKNSQSAPAVTAPQAAAQEQLNELNALKSQLAPPTVTSTVAAPIQETITGQAKALNSLQQGTNSGPLSPAQVENQLNELNTLRSK